MRRLALVLLITAGFAGPAAALEVPPLCTALHGLGNEARTSGQPQRISAGVNLTGPADCRALTDTPATRAFCDAAAHESGLAWRVQDCVETLAAEPQITTRAEHAERRSRNAITHLAAKLGHGVRLDLSEAAGRYDLVVWLPK